jgi:VIT1/CCC1 family predicted Fe2+/Mn2+ transporter
MHVKQRSDLSLAARVRRSFNASAGEIVFGMEDGAVSIFGLVFGVAATTDQNSVVLIAGISGAFAAAVSMMAGSFLDRQSESDQTRVRTAAIVEAVAADPKQAAAQMVDRLTGAGLDRAAATEVVAAVRSKPAALQGLATALAFAAPDANEEGPMAHASWMLIADLFASLVPVVPFMLLPIGPARIMSVALTGLLMLVLGIWRARLGRRRTLVTALQTLGIATAAGIAGLVAGRFVDGWFGG